MSDEILRTANTSLKCRPLMERLESSLSHSSADLATAIPAERLSEMNRDFRECQAGMRRHELWQPEKKFMAYLEAMAEAFMALDDDNVSTLKSKDGEAVLDGLLIFKDRPSHHSLAQDLRSWMTKMSGTMAVADLIDLSIEAAKADVSDLTKLASVMERCNGLKVSADEDIAHVASLLVTSLRALVIEARERDLII